MVLARQRRARQLLANADRARNAALLLGAGACLATLLLCAILLGWLTRPLVGLAEAVEVLAQGEGDPHPSAAGEQPG